MKLLCHPKSFSDDSLVIATKDFPGLKIGDIVEIYLPDDTYRFVMYSKSHFTVFRIIPCRLCTTVSFPVGFYFK